MERERLQKKSVLFNCAEEQFAKQKAERFYILPF